MEFKRPARQNSQIVPARPSAATNPRTTEQSVPAQTVKSSRRKITRKTIAITSIALVIAATILWLVNNAASESSNSGKTTQVPEYQTILPIGKSINDLGGWKRVSPPENEPVFAYTDQIDGVTISVSQQPLPDSFKSNLSSQVAEVAKKFNATSKIDANGTTLYIGTSAKGPQSTIFTKKNLLILIKSQKKINDKSWIGYVKTLGQKYEPHPY